MGVYRDDNKYRHGWLCRPMRGVIRTKKITDVICRGFGLLIDPDDGLVRRRLYYSCLLGDMFPPIMMEVLKQHGMETPDIMPGGSKRCHGAPMAAQPEIRCDWTLQRLHSRKLPATKIQETLSDDDSKESTRTPQFEQHQPVREESDLHNHLRSAPQGPVNRAHTQSGIAECGQNIEGTTREQRTD